MAARPGHIIPQSRLVRSRAPHWFSEQRRLQERMERNPTEFLMVELPSALRTSAEHLATFIKCAGLDLAFIENATEGCSTLLASIRLSAGDEILLTYHGYPAI